MRSLVISDFSEVSSFWLTTSSESKYSVVGLYTEPRQTKELLQVLDFFSKFVLHVQKDLIDWPPFKDILIRTNLPPISTAWQVSWVAQECVVILLVLWIICNLETWGITDSVLYQNDVQDEWKAYRPLWPLARRCFEEVLHISLILRQFPTAFHDIFVIPPPQHKPAQEDLHNLSV